MSAQESRLLSELTAGVPALQGLVELYKKSNGVDLFNLKCPNCEVPHPALSFFPVSEWEAVTAPWLPGGDMASFMEGCELYVNGVWRVIATFPSEEMRLVAFFKGQDNGEDMAGRIYCIGLDGYLGFEEIVAESVDALLESIVNDPAAFFNRVGFSWHVDTDHGCFGDSIDGYVPDQRLHPDRAPWPPTRPLT